jgi:hypothetical protein
MLEEAFAENDAVTADYERWQRDYERRRQQQTATKQRSTPSGLVRKTYVPTQQQSAAMDPITEAKWNAWVEGHIKNALAAHMSLTRK